ncbi:inner centromere protein [Eublepharis macularius]|uniref:Inner centromere protein n=1 Tax=Eublepharis macularius TaxID=481883 RepID=A0AA97IYE4_EUBMA|nr:inner centromere protein [Eublepharis macularius]XP_054827791.1 inner centromere protein [Eublepharis macularius]XP_054827792.1 inner centromere protein [Eublepharis macularius]
MLDFTCLEEQCNKKISEFLHNVDNRDFVWLEEILEEANKIFKSNFNGEPELMPKTPSQKNRKKKKRFSTTKNDQFSEKRLLETESNQSSPAQRTSKRLQQKNLENTSPCHRMTRSQAARISHASCKTATIDLARGRIPLVEINNNERLSAELQIQKIAVQKTEKAALANESTLDGEFHREKLKPLSKASLLVAPGTPETQITKEGRSACKLKIANAAVVKTTAIEEPSPQAEDLLAQQPQKSQASETKLSHKLNETARISTALKANSNSVRRSLMGRTSLNKSSLVQRCSLASKRGRAVQKSAYRTMSKKSIAREQSSVCGRVSCRVSLEKIVVEEIIESRPQLDPAAHSQEVADQLCPHSPKVPRTAAVEEQPEEESKENNFEKNAKVQEQPQSVRRKASYKRAVNELYDGQPTEDELSPPRKKSPSPQCPASKVVRPFKTFLHTVHKNQVLMMTPGSVSRNSAIKSFLKHNTPVRTNPKEKERQRLENLKKKEEAEQQRKQKMEEEKRRRLEEMKRKREERLRKVLQARERAEQREEEKKKLLEQKLAQHNEKVREEKIAEEKMKRAAAAKKAEELEARKQRALHLEEERRLQELMQKKKEEEQEKARQVAELEKKLAAERELEKKREQEKLQAQQEHEQKEKEKAARLQRELMAAKEKEQLQKETEEKERKLQEEQQKQKTTSDATVGSKQLNVTVEIQNSPSCNSYPMTPQGPKQPKIDLNNYGMDLNSDDSTDDESQPRKPIPAWATGNQLTQAIIHQYYNPPDTDAFFGVIKSPKLEEIFYKSKPRYLKRTSSAVWNSPPFPNGKSMAGPSWQGLKRC